jgi:hypothetical protein
MGVLEELFPGLFADLMTGRVPVMNDFSQARASFGGHLMCFVLTIDAATPRPSPAHTPDNGSSDRLGGH